MNCFQETENKLKELCEMKESIISCFKAQLAMGVDNIDTHEAYEVTDIIKDMFEAEKYAWESCYYKTVVEAMSEESNDERYGYNPRRGSNGRFMPKYYAGDGSMGYRPYIDQEPYIDAYLKDPKFAEKMRSGYGMTSGSNGGNNGSGRMGYDQEMERRMMGMGFDVEVYPKYGQAYNDYRSAKKYYTQTNSSEGKEQMEKHANEHIRDTITTIREMWDDADANMRKRMKNDLSNLVEELDA